VGLRERYFDSLGVSRRDFVFYQYLSDRSFVHAVRDGRPAVPGFPDAFAAHALVDAAYRSAGAGGAPARPARHW